MGCAKQCMVGAPTFEKMAAAHTDYTVMRKRLRPRRPRLRIPDPAFDETKSPKYTEEELRELCKRRALSSGLVLDDVERMSLEELTAECDVSWCTMPDFVHIPDPDSGVFYKFNTQAGQAALWKIRRELQRQTREETYLTIDFMFANIKHGKKSMRKLEGAWNHRGRSFLLIMFYILVGVEPGCASLLALDVKASLDDKD